MTTVCKLGGSLITAKDGDGAITTETLARIARIVTDADPTSLVLIHGGGSFGHRAADRHGVSAADGTHDPTAIRAVTGAMDRLNEAVIDALIDAGIPGVALPPRSAATKDAEERIRLASDAIAGYLEADMVPVLHGDLVATAGQGATVLSGDELAVAVADTLDAERIGLCAGVPGVLEEDGSVVPSVSHIDAVAPLFDDPDGTDVTGGMQGKVETLLASPVDGAIFGIDQLSAFLDGEMPGTVVHAR